MIIPLRFRGLTFFNARVPDFWLLQFRDVYFTPLDLGVGGRYVCHFQGGFLMLFRDALRISHRNRRYNQFQDGSGVDID